MLWRRVLEKIVGEVCRSEVLKRSVGGESCREMLEKSVVEKCWRRV